MSTYRAEKTSRALILICNNKCFIYKSCLDPNLTIYVINKTSLRRTDVAQVHSLEVSLPDDRHGDDPI